MGSNFERLGQGKVISPEEAGMKRNESSQVEYRRQLAGYYAELCKQEFEASAPESDREDMDLFLCELNTLIRTTQDYRKAA